MNTLKESLIAKKTRMESRYHSTRYQTAETELQVTLDEVIDALQVHKNGKALREDQTVAEFSKSSRQALYMSITVA